ncbi:MAG TPA: alpha/beta fold hydrolase [Thermoanaerobaculia bacterium]|nr:alpha/beta fold hydrolase [Thermoanaerobaculia bacterium]
MDRIPIPGAGSHLAVLFDAPARQNGLCILYLHGFGSMQTGEKADFFRQRALESGFAFCSFDFQGHGQSGGTMRDLTLTRNLEDVAWVHDYVRERGCESVCLLGSSMGGGTALWYSALHPDEVVAGLHIAPALQLEKGLTAWAGPERCRAWQETGSIHFENDLVSCELGWELIEDLRSRPYEELLQSYRTPALLLQGKLDTSVSWKDVADFATRCAYPGIDFHLFADGDHRLTDRKDRLWALMLEFLQGKGLI